MIKERLSVAMIILAGALWGTMGLFVRSLAADNLITMEIVFFRSLASALILLIYMLIADRALLKINIKDIWCFVGTGIVSLTTFNICYFTTIQKTSMAVAAILLYTSPIFVVIMSAILFKETLTVRKVIALVIAFTGCVLVTGVTSAGGLTMSISGIIIGIGAGVGYALYSIFGRYAIEKGYESTTISFYTFVFSSIGILFISPFLAPVNVTVNKIAQGNTITDILLIVGIAIVATVLPYVLYTKGLSKVENGKAGIMASVEPVVATILGIVIYKERLSASTLAGIVLVLIAIVLLNMKKKNKHMDENG